MSYLSVNLRHLMKFKPLFTENLLKKCCIMFAVIDTKLCFFFLVCTFLALDECGWKNK